MEYTKVYLDYNKTPQDEVKFVAKRGEHFRKVIGYKGESDLRTFDVQHMFAKIFHEFPRDMDNKWVVELICDAKTLDALQVLTNLRILNCIQSNDGYFFEINW